MSDFSIQSSVLDTGVGRGEKRNARRRFGAALFHLQIFPRSFFSLCECCGVLYMYVHVLYNSTKSIFTFFLFPFSAYISLTFSFYNLRFFTLNNEIFNVFSFSWNSVDWSQTNQKMATKTEPRWRVRQTGPFFNIIPAISVPLTKPSKQKKKHKNTRHK